MTSRPTSVTTGRPNYRRFIAFEEKYGVTIVRINARRIDAQVYEDVFAELVKLVDKVQPKKLLLNLTGVHYIYSTALSRLITLHKRIKMYKGELRLCELEPEVAELFEVTQLKKLFDIRQDESSALEKFW